MPHSDLWAALTFITEPGSTSGDYPILRADEPLREYVPGIRDGEIVTGTEIRFVRYLSDRSCIIELNGRQVMLTEKEARKIFVGWKQV